MSSNASCSWRSPAILAVLVVQHVFLGVPAAAQDFSVLRINEVIPRNQTQGPMSSLGQHQDMIEIYNSGDEPLMLGRPTFRERVGMTDTSTLPVLGLWTFPVGSTIQPKGFLVVFLLTDLDGCDLGASNWALASDGSRPITLWGPSRADGTRPILDQLWLPPLPKDVSFGRRVDGAGPAPMPVAETLAHCCYFPAGATTFGTCSGGCATFDRSCTGAPNGSCGNIPPRIRIQEWSTNAPAAAEDVSLTVRVSDDQDPVPPDLRRVFIRYRVNGSAVMSEVEMVHDAADGVLDDAARGKPLDRWSLWRGTIPGQPAGALVEFSLHAEDAGGLSGSLPDLDKLCPEGVGPCNLVGVPGPACVREPAPSLLFRSCEVLLRYVVGYEPARELRGLLINEVAPDQFLLQDPTGSESDYYDECASDFDDELGAEEQEENDADVRDHEEDYFELLNTSSSAVDLGGLWLAVEPFGPRGWEFPRGATIGPRQCLIVWADEDGGLCPRPLDAVLGDRQECPDPSSVDQSSYHTNFELEERGGQIYLFDREENGFGVIHGVRFPSLETNVTFGLFPDGDPNGAFFPMEATPCDPNKGPFEFLRGDAERNCAVSIGDAMRTLNALFLSSPASSCPDAADVDDNGRIDITDPIYLLSSLFLGGPLPPAPGYLAAGIDPTPDELPFCSIPCSRG